MRSQALEKVVRETMNLAKSEGDWQAKNAECELDRRSERVT